MSSAAFRTAENEAPDQQHILLLKMSSLGDVVHTFPALTDAIEARPGLSFHWVVEEAFADLAGCHPAVARVIPIALRRWRKTPWRCRKEFADFRRALAQQRFDMLLDAQGLIKSAAVARLVRTQIRVGYDWRSARESLASLAYDKRCSVPRHNHAIERTRLLFALALGYAPPAEAAPRYGMIDDVTRGSNSDSSYLVFLHGSAWSSKQWPLDYWRDLAQRAAAKNLQVHLPSGNVLEQKRAQAIAADFDHCSVLPAMDLMALMSELRGAAGVVCVDSGLGHLAAACEVPVVGLYGATEPERTGLVGTTVVSLQSTYPCSPCFKRHCPLLGADESDAAPPCVRELKPDMVWQHVTSASKRGG